MSTDSKDSGETTRNGDGRTGILSEVVSAMTRTRRRADRSSLSETDAGAIVIIIPLNVEHDLAALR